MILHHQLNTAPVRASDAVPTQQRFEQERRARLERMRRAATTVPVNAASARPLSPFHPRRIAADIVQRRLMIQAAQNEWGFHPDPAPYDMLHMSISIAPAKLSWRDIVDEVCEARGVTYEEVQSDLRSVRIVAARFEAIYRIREERHLSWAQLGRLFNRDHTSALHGYRKHKARLEAEARKATA